MNTINYKGFSINIIQDENPINPREEFDNFGTMICFHRRYILGDKHSYYNSETVLSEIVSEVGPIISLPVYMYDHSGITIKTSPFSCPWDSGQIGYIYISKAQARKEFNVKHLSKKIIQKCIDNLKSEVSTYNDYLTGNVYGFSVKDKNNNELDSCYGFFGDPETSGCIDEAKAVVDFYIKAELKIHLDNLKSWIKSKVSIEFRKPWLV
jgi:hypothetical protein